MVLIFRRKETHAHTHPPAQTKEERKKHTNECWMRLMCGDTHLNREPLYGIDGTISTSHVFLIDCGVLRISCSTSTAFCMVTNRALNHSSPVFISFALLLFETFILIVSLSLRTSENKSFSIHWHNLCVIHLLIPLYISHLLLLFCVLRYYAGAVYSVCASHLVFK